MLVLLAVELQPAGTPAVTLLGANIFGAWPPLYGSWVHMAFVRNGNVIIWYVQGKPMTFGTVPASTNFSASAASPLYIGGDTTTRAYSGLLSNFRVVVGTALYPVVFPVPTSPLPAVAGTLVLLRAATQAAALVDSSGRGVVVNATGVSWNASAPTGFGGSLSFSGSTASIIAFPSSSAALGSVSRVPCMVWCPFHSGALLFCRRILLWSFGSMRRVVQVSMQRGLYRCSHPPTACPLTLARMFAAVHPFSIGCCTTLLSIELKSAGTSLLVYPTGSATSTYTAVWGTWQHMVVVRIATRLYWFVQGSLVATAAITATTNISASDAAPMFIGGDNTTARGE